MARPGIKKGKHAEALKGALWATERASIRRDARLSAGGMPFCCGSVTQFRWSVRSWHPIKGTPGVEPTRLTPPDRIAQGNNESPSACGNNPPEAINSERKAGHARIETPIGSRPPHCPQTSSSFAAQPRAPIPSDKPQGRTIRCALLPSHPLPVSDDIPAQCSSRQASGLNGMRLLWWPFWPKPHKAAVHPCRLDIRSNTESYIKKCTPRFLE